MLETTLASMIYSKTLVAFFLNENSLCRPFCAVLSITKDTQVVLDIWLLT